MIPSPRAPRDLQPPPPSREPAAEAAFQRLASAYAGLPTGFDTPPAERHALDAAVHEAAATYGEITPEGAARLLNWWAPEPPDVIVDLGSGGGRFCLQAALTTRVGRVLGVELSPHRHGIALRARQRLMSDPASHEPARRVTFLHQDLRFADFRAATLLWCGSTCFSEQLMDDLARRLAAAPRLRRVVTLRPFGTSVRRLFEEIGSVTLPMTWAPRIRAHVYSRRAWA